MMKENVWTDRKWKDKDGLCVGIDLGTSNSCVSIWREKRAMVVLNENGKKTTPSITTFAIEKGDKFPRLVGSNRHETGHLVEIRHAKRLMGVSNPSKETLKYMSDLVGCPVRKRKRRTDVTTSDVELCVSPLHFIMPEEVSAATLAKLKQIVEKKFNEEVTHAVVTVPAYFDHGQRLATRAVRSSRSLSPPILIPLPSNIVSFMSTGSRYGRFSRRRTFERTRSCSNGIRTLCGRIKRYTSI